MTIGSRVRMYREQNGLTQRELGAKAFVSQVAINKIEHDFMKPGVDLLVRLSNIFGCTIDELLKEAE